MLWSFCGLFHFARLKNESGRVLQKHSLHCKKYVGIIFKIVYNQLSFFLWFLFPKLSAFQLCLACLVELLWHATRGNKKKVNKENTDNNVHL